MTRPLPPAVRVGRRSSVHETVEFVIAGDSTVTIGDYCVIGPGCRFVVSAGHVTIGDWTTLHNNALVLSTAGVTIGQHCWFGQNGILDGSGGLSIGNNVRVGMYSQIWSHVAAGEQIEGCTLFGERPVTLQDGVWLVGSCIVASGVTLGPRLVALIGSNITKSFPGDTVIAGVPAVARENLSFYQPIDLDRKMALLRQWLAELAGPQGLTMSETDGAITLADGEARVHFVQTTDTALRLAADDPAATVCDVALKRYRKTFTDLEHRVLKSLSGNKARFLSSPDWT